MTPKDKEETDQSMRIVSGNFSEFWHLLYADLIREGFSEKQAFTLVITYVKTTCEVRG